MVRIIRLLLTPYNRFWCLKRLTHLVLQTGSQSITGSGSSDLRSNSLIEESNRRSQNHLSSKKLDQVWAQGTLERFGIYRWQVMNNVGKSEGAIDDIRAEQFIFSVDAVLGLRLKNKRPKINFSRLGGVTAGVVTMSPTGSGFDLSYGHDHIGDNL